MQITEQAQRAGAINHMLRDFARKSEFQRSAVDINELIQQVVKLMEFDVRQHDVVLRLELGSHVPKVLADRIQIEQVLVNLIRNAIEAMLAGLTKWIEFAITRHEIEEAYSYTASGSCGEVAAIRKLATFFMTKP